jgi:hypothetical protein
MPLFGGTALPGFARANLRCLGPDGRVSTFAREICVNALMSDNELADALRAARQRLAHRLSKAGDKLRALSGQFDHTPAIKKALAEEVAEVGGRGRIGQSRGETQQGKDNMSEHQDALAAEARQIDRLLIAGKDSALEREKLSGAVALGQRLAEHLQSEVADEGSWVDTGCDGSGYEAFVMVKGREYQVYVSPRSTRAELAEWETSLQEEASQWDLLCPRVINALRTADPQLAAEFERHVSPAQVGRNPEGGDAT